MVPIPFMLAMALQEDGWYLRADIVWSKCNPMPESVTDRPTKAHEYVFLLTSSPRYFFDQEAVREPAEWARWGDQTNGKHEGSGSAAGWIGDKPKEDLQRRNPSWAERKAAGAGSGSLITGHNASHGAGLSHDLGDPSRGRNIRSVWEIATQPYAEAHFATFPEALVERCVKAGTSERGCCPECGAPWERETERTEIHSRERTRNVGGCTDGLTRPSGPGEGFYTSVSTTGWRQTCLCSVKPAGEPCLHLGPGDEVCPFCLEPTPPVPCTVLDPFSGSGTTALVARRLGRKSIGIELNEEYARLAGKRLQQLSLLTA